MQICLKSINLYSNEVFINLIYEPIELTNISLVLLEKSKNIRKLVIFPINPSNFNYQDLDQILVNYKFQISDVLENNLFSIVGTNKYLWKDGKIHLFNNLRFLYLKYFYKTYDSIEIINGSICENLEIDLVSLLIKIYNKFSNSEVSYEEINQLMIDIQKETRKLDNERLITGNKLESDKIMKIFNENYIENSINVN